MVRNEAVVLLAGDGSPVGTADKHDAHHADTPLHLAFSCHLHDQEGRLLMTRRALGKLTWPGVWTNSFCGHPMPGEPLEDAVHRRAREELGARITGLRPLMPRFRYRAVDPGGIVENEICPVFRATLAGPVAHNPDEVMDAEWVDPRELAQAVRLAPFAFSPWLVIQLNELATAGDG